MKSKTDSILKVKKPFPIIQKLHFLALGFKNHEKNAYHDPTFLKILSTNDPLNHFVNFYFEEHSELLKNIWC